MVLTRKVAYIQAAATLMPGC